MVQIPSHVKSPTMLRFPVHLSMNNLIVCLPSYSVNLLSAFCFCKDEFRVEPQLRSFPSRIKFSLGETAAPPSPRFSASQGLGELGWCYLLPFDFGGLPFKPMQGRPIAITWLSLGNISHFCLLWFSRKSPLNCCKITHFSPSNVNQDQSHW